METPLITKINRPGDAASGQIAIQGWLHAPLSEPRAAVALTHGAGSNCGAALLVAMADVLAEHGYCVLRYDLPFRQARPAGPPVGGKKGQAVDRDGIRAAAAFLRERTPGLPVYLAGHSYGGRQSTMAASEDSSLAEGMLLLSYPLHPPGQAAKLRTEHFPALQTPALFAHGTKDEFGSPEEMRPALALIPARTELLIIDRAGHGLIPSAAATIVQTFSSFLNISDTKKGRA